VAGFLSSAGAVMAMVLPPAGGELGEAVSVLFSRSLLDTNR